MGDFKKKRGGGVIPLYELCIALTKDLVLLGWACKDFLTRIRYYVAKKSKHCSKTTSQIFFVS